MSAMFARLPARVMLPLVAMLTAIASAGLPDLDTIREWIKRIQQFLALGGIALALGFSLIFIVAWVLSHLRKPRVLAEGEEPGAGWLSKIALGSSFLPVALTIAAAVGLFVPLLKPLMLKLFAYAVLVAGVSWLICIAALIVGGGREELARIRRALLLAGTPFYCLAVWISRFL
ncbi:hypothetical protein ACNOYE_09200 [Nannocystaceae bacterium ST9]